MKGQIFQKYLVTLTYPIFMLCLTWSDLHLILPHINTHTHTHTHSTELPCLANFKSKLVLLH